MRDLFFLTVGGFRAPRTLVEPHVPLWQRGSCNLPLTVAVVVRDDGGLVLIDAGFSAAACADFLGELGPLRWLSLQAEVTATDALIHQLPRLDLDPARVTTVIATHLHLDHIGGIADFPQAELVTTADELQAFASLPPNSGYRAADLARASRIRVVRLQAGPQLGFPASHDLLGDGEITLLDARGHTRGHVAVALQGPAGLVVHIGDAVYQSWEYREEGGGPCRLATLTAADREEQRRTYLALRRAAADPQRPLLVPSHDPEVYAGLPHAPRQTATNP